MNRQYLLGFTLGVIVCSLVLVFVSNPGAKIQSTVSNIIRPDDHEFAKLRTQVEHLSEVIKSSSCASNAANAPSPSNGTPGAALRSVITPTSPASPAATTAPTTPPPTTPPTRTPYTISVTPPPACTPPPVPLVLEYREHRTIDKLPHTLDPVRKEPRKFYDMFMFNGEFALLEIRLEELWDVVDRFILVEAATNQVGGKKPLYFQENKQRFQKYMSKIEHIIAPSGHESAQRDHMMNAVSGLPADALIMLSDLDEIPRCWVIHRLRYMEPFPTEYFILLKMDMFYYSYRWAKANPDRLFQIHTQTIAKVFLRSYLNSHRLSEIAGAHHHPNRLWFIDKAGWHCSYCFTPERIRFKIQGLAHTEYHGPPYTNLDHIQKVMSSGQDLFLRGGEEMRLVANDVPDVPYLVKTQSKRLKLFYPDLSADKKSVVLPSKEDIQNAS